MMMNNTKKNSKKTNNYEFRQFEMFLDGMSFFDMPQIFELGGVRHQAALRYIHNNEDTTATLQPVMHTPPPSNVSVPSIRRNTYPEIRSDITVQSELSYEASMFEPTSRPPIQSDMTVKSADPISRIQNHYDFAPPPLVVQPSTYIQPLTAMPPQSYMPPPSSMQPPAPMQPPISMQPPTSMQPPLSMQTPTFMQPPILMQPPTSFQPHLSMQPPTSFQPSAPAYMQPPAPMQPHTAPFTNNTPANKFVPSGPSHSTFQNMSNQIMNAYGKPSSNSAILAIENGPATENGFSSMNKEPSQTTPLQNHYVQTPPPAHIHTVPTFSLIPQRDSPVSTMSTPEYTEKPSIYFSNNKGQTKESSQYTVQQGMQNLVNFEHMCESLESSPTQNLTVVKEEEKPKSQGLPPTQVAWHLGTQVPLADIKANSGSRENPTKEVMRTFNSVPPQATFVHGFNQAPPQNSFVYNAYSGGY
eukprot:CAMPEP_0194133458 /NCGR_PEP_ID=MMETSP0152-20130528/3624_1 /TAXON_ID=1049557 /ORGANISM="Thalassiothrix antarctica, Strain L6-D1" /LENGTH=469 /DNA_ID=CAMNT_0038828777 /DNA_START=402 /DNA_END=1811 /DNA_ORIENTATION=+